MTLDKGKVSVLKYPDHLSNIGMIFPPLGDWVAEVSWRHRKIDIQLTTSR